MYYNCGTAIAKKANKAKIPFHYLHKGRYVIIVVRLGRDGRYKHLLTHSLTHSLQDNLGKPAPEKSNQSRY